MAEAVLLRLPEPQSEQLEALLDQLSSSLPNLRRLLLPFAKRLPFPAGGRPKKLASPGERQKIRDEIGLLMAKGLTTENAQGQLAQREGVSRRTIQRIWQERKEQRI
jgi:hypothetical protein